MGLPPLIERELRVALRKQRPRRARLMLAAGCAGAAVLFLLMAGLFEAGNAGRDLHRLLCGVGAYLILRTPLSMAGVFAGERSNQTLGLLFLSGLSAGEIFVSKLFSASIMAFNGLLAIFPLLALPFLTGGVSFQLFVVTIFTLPNLLLFALAVTVLASVLAEDDGSATVLAGVVAALLCVAPLLVYFGQSQFVPGAGLSPWWLRLSPALAPYLVWTGMAGIPVSECWANFLVTLGWSLVCLVGAGFALQRLRRNWQESPEPGRWAQRWSQLIHGTSRGSEYGRPRPV